jgi:uncharacterized membrane protein
VSDVATFVGRFHPLLVHLPIGFLLLACAFELIAWRRASLAGPHALDAAVRSHWRDASGAALLLGALAAVTAVVTGLLLGESGGYGGDTFEWHERIGILTALVSLAASVIWLRIRAARPPSLAAVRVYRACSGVRGVLVAIGGPLGGTLTHGEGYLTDHAPAPLRAWLARVGLAAAPAVAATASGEQANAYQAVVRPVLDTHCTACHRSGFAKGALVLDTTDGIRKGGEHGAAFVSGRSLASDAIRRVFLPASHPDVMPPAGRAGLRPGDAALLRWWVDAGMPFDKKIADLEIGDDTRPILEGVVGPLRRGGPTLPATDPGPIDAAAVATAERAGLSVVPIEPARHFVEVHATNAGSGFGDGSLGALDRLGPHVVWLDLGGTRVSDAGLTHVASLTNLTRLHLNRTQVGDAGLASLKTLAALEYLNLYGTRVTDEGLAHLAALPRLKVVYLWQTAVTVPALDRLRAAHPRLDVQAGDGTASAGGGAPASDSK